jgi:ATP-dependent DNA helicase RecG
VEIPISKVENSLSIIHFIINVIPSGEPITYLSNQDLIKVGYCRVSGVLLFCDEPAVYLPKRSSVKIMRYKTKGSGLL